MKMLLRILLVLLPFLWSVWAVAQKKQDRDCSTTCFSTEVLSSDKISETCREYEWKITYSGSCAHALSHYSVGISCGEISDLSNSQNWKQVLGTDPTTGLKGFKIDDIEGFGETSLNSFTVKFTLCTTDDACAEQLSCWEPVVAYKASTCVNYDTLDASCGQLIASLQKNDISCFGEADGSLTAVVEQGQEPYTYLWSNGNTSPGISGLMAGTYSVTIKDASGEELTLKDSIQEPVPVSLSHQITNASCSGRDNGAIALTTDGNNYTFLWSNGATTEDISGLEAGIYSVTVTDLSGCSYNESFTVNNDANIMVTVDKLLPGCNNADGALDITVVGGIAPYTFTWSNGAVTEDLDSLSGGFYTVTITDNGGCSIQQSFDLREINTLKLSATPVQTSCIEDASGSIDLTVTGGTAPYTYLWTNGETTEDISGLTSGYYTVTVTDVKGCAKTLRVYVSKKTFIVPAHVVQPVCAGDSTGSVSLQEPVGGESPYTYLWSTGETGNSISGLPAGTYSVMVTDNSGCSRQLYFVIIDPEPITSSWEVLNDQCDAEGFFTIDLTVSGGTAPYTYVWSNGSTIEDPELLRSGNYSVSITDANGCTSGEDVIIQKSDSVLSCSIIPPDTIPVCGSINNTLAAGVDADAYRWMVESSDLGWVITSGHSSSTILFTAGSINSAAIFTLTTTEKGCTQTCSYAVSTCTSNGNGSEDPGGENPGEEEPGGEDPGEEDPGQDVPGTETCEECFGSSIIRIAEDGQCSTYEVVVETNGNCRHALSHWSIEIACGTVSNAWNSEGWKMETGYDPTTGLHGLKVDDIDSFGETPDSFIVRFTVCNNTCNEEPESFDSVVAYKAGTCIGYDSLHLNAIQLAALKVSAYPNPFRDKINFEWQADEAGSGKLEILNQFGQTISLLFEGKMDKGEIFNFQWSSNDSNKAIYYYRFTTTKKEVYGKIFRN